MKLLEGLRALQKANEEEGIWPGGVGIWPKVWRDPVGVGKSLWGPRGRKWSMGCGEALGRPGEVGLC